MGWKLCISKLLKFLTLFGKKLYKFQICFLFWFKSLTIDIQIYNKIYYYYFFKSKRDLFVAYRGELYIAYIRNNLCWKYWFSTTLISFSLTARTVFSERVCLFQRPLIYTCIDEWYMISNNPSTHEKYWSQLASLIKTSCSTCNQAI